MKYRLYWKTDADGLMHPHLNMRGGDSPLWKEVPLNGTVAISADCQSVLCRDMEKFILDSCPTELGIPDGEWLFDPSMGGGTTEGVLADGMWRNGGLSVPVITLPFGMALGDMDDECHPQMPLLSDLIRVLREEGLANAGRQEAMDMTELLTDDTALRTVAHRYIGRQGKEARNE